MDSPDLEEYTYDNLFNPRSLVGRVGFGDIEGSWRSTKEEGFAAVASIIGLAFGIGLQKTMSLSELC